jgi:hypothetical protein
MILPLELAADTVLRNAIRETVFQKRAPCPEHITGPGLLQGHLPQPQTRPRQEPTGAGHFWLCAGAIPVPRLAGADQLDTLIEHVPLLPSLS